MKSQTNLGACVKSGRRLGGLTLDTYLFVVKTIR